jgi:hypothetical protein
VKLLLSLLIMMGISTAQAATPADVATADQVVWAGLDYSMVKMYGTQDFNDPGAIFPGYLNKWNDLYGAEMMTVLSKTLKKQVVFDGKSVTAANEKATESQIIREDGKKLEEKSHITPDDIANAVKAYDLKTTNGIGLVFIIDRLVKPSEQGCSYVVFFDIASREVALTKRICANAGGFGFRNYWFKPIKETTAACKKYQKW